jgi:methionyl aminopeptidase
VLPQEAFGERISRLRHVSVETEEEFEALRAAGRVVARALRAMRQRVRPGVTTAELDEVGARVFRAAGARSGPQLDYGFPGVNCISVNDEAIHGIPGRRRLREGDLVKLDVTAELDGFYADACVSVPVGRPRPGTTHLVQTAHKALANAMEVARVGAPLNAIGAAVEGTVLLHGYAVCSDLCGHGIGRRIHEYPTVPNYHDPRLSQPLTDGLVLTIEPVISAGTGSVHAARDGWAVHTSDGAMSAHVEHTLVITQGKPLILTAA